MRWRVERLWEWLAYLWRTPNAFRTDWRRFWKNQAGHGGIGIACGLATGLAGSLLSWWWGFGVGAFCLSFYALWEYSQWQFRRGEASDCWEDWAYFYTGFMVGLLKAWLFVPAMVAHLIAGILWRVEEHGA